MKKGDTARAVVVRTKREYRRAPTAATSSSTTNSAVLINTQNEPIGTRIFGPVARELRAQEVHEDHLARAGGAVMSARIERATSSSVISGKDKGKQGKVTKLFIDDDKVVVEGVNLVKRHINARRREPAGRQSSSASSRSTPRT